MRAIFAITGTLPSRPIRPPVFGTSILNSGLPTTPTTLSGRKSLAYILAPVNNGNQRLSIRILEENLPAAIAILRFNGIEVEVEK